MAKQTMTDESGAEVEAVVDEQTGEMVPAEGQEVPREGDLGLAEYLQTEQQDDELPELSAYRQIIAQILSSETPEDVLTPIEAVNARDITDQVFELYDFQIQRSDYDVGAPIYLSMLTVLEDTGEKTVINTGNQAVMAQLVSLKTMHEASVEAREKWEADGGKGEEPQTVFPRRMKVVERGKPNQYGNYPLRLVSPDYQPRR